MSEMRTARRAVGDIASVCLHARPASAARWLTSFAAHLPECQSTRSLAPADRIWARAGARFRPAGGMVISLPPAYTAGAREMYCRNVYLRTGFAMPRTGWVLDLGANRGLFSVWAALAGAQAVAVEAQQGFEVEIQCLAERNGVGDRVHVEIAMAGEIVTAGATVGVVADDQALGNYLTRRAAATCRRVGAAADVGLPDRQDRTDEGRYRRRRVRDIRPRRRSALAGAGRPGGDGSPRRFR